MIPNLNYFIGFIISLMCTSRYEAIEVNIQDTRKSELTDCLVDIIENLLGTVRKVSFVTSPDDNTFLEDTIRRIRAPVLVNTIEKANKTEIDRRVRNDVVIVHGAVNVSSVLKTVLWNAGTRFLVVYCTRTKMEEDFREFWNERVIKVFGLLEETEGVSLYSFSPYQEGDCDSTKPIRLDTWYKGTFSGDGLSFVNDDFRIRTGNGCPLYASASQAEPSVLLPKSKRCIRDSEIDGVEARFVLEFAVRLNFTLTICIPKDGHSWGSLNPPVGVLGDIGRRVTDFGCGGFVQIPSRYGRLEFSYPYSEKDCMTFAVPARAGRDQLQWLTNLQGNLKLIHWTLIIASFISVSGFLCLCGSYTPMAALLYNLSSFLGRSVVVPRRTSLKILVFFWIIFSSLVNDIYLASLGREITLPLESSEIETFRQLLDAGLRLAGHPNSLKVLNTYDPTHVALGNRLMPTDTDPALELERIVTQRDSSFILSIRLLMYKLRLDPRLRGNIKILKECVKNYFPVMVLQKNSPFSSKFDYLILKISEAGISEYWQSIFFRDRLSKKSKFKPLTIMRSLGIFAILVGGLTLAVIVFLGELGVNYSKKIMASRKFTNARTNAF